VKVVLDTNVLISATLFSGSLAEKLFDKLLIHGAQIYCSTAILSEYELIVRRDFAEHRKLVSVQENLHVFMARIIQAVCLVEPRVKVTLERDPMDAHILECALASASDYIVTFDEDLLELKEYENIRIIHPLEMVTISEKIKKE